MQACVAYRTHNTQQTVRRNSSVDECPADEMVEGEHEVGKDDSDAYDYDYIETSTLQKISSQITKDDDINSFF